MSKIKDLLAETEGIDDLKPVKIPVITYVEKLANEVFKLAVRDKTRDEIYNRANYDFGEDDEGHKEVYLENFLDICKDIATDWLDELIQTQHHDLTDTEYFEIIELASARLADHYADYESELCEEVLADDKYKLDELAERNGRC